ncbi:cadherin-like domain-containing protein [Diaphorobacter sp. HDW4B]|uniref:Ig-like domain-containing protein n=1 Tax=Diaphorobacter sp. HDW4B TaxID=2714925 RepID=UPI00140B0F4C|nr:cadherin-like domain-containing protein [Diaphorobacter sp. HDW4B]QIL72227.1 cadherin-like domain-containing protein [Diaphorobacter sp. HDW4B]
MANDTITIYGAAPNHNTGPKVAYEVFTNQAVDGVLVHHKTVIYTNAQQVSGVQLAVQPLVNNPPVDPDDTNTAYKNATLTVSAANGVLNGASDPDTGDILSILWFQLPGDTTVYAAGQTANIAGVGTLQINADGSYVFTPAANYVGPVPVSTYTVTDGNGGLDTSTLTITMANNDPPIDGNEVETTPQGTPISKNVLSNATDPQNDPLSITGFVVGGTPYNPGDTATLPGVGTLLINADGSYVFTPLVTYTGAVPQATYTVSDGHGGVDTSTLDITITPHVPAAPASTPEDTPVPVTGVTIPPAGATVTTTVTVTNGTATVSTGGATVTGNGTSTITITGTPAQVNAALSGLTFTNTPDYNGPASVTITPDNGAAPQTVPIPVTPVVDVTDDARTTPLNTPVTIPVLANDSFENPARVISEINGQAVTVGTPITVTNGTVTVQADNTVIFTPDKDYTGTAQFTYTVSAGGVKETANVTVTVNGSTAAPTPVPVGGSLFGGLMVTLMAAWGMRNLRRRKP